MLRWPIPLNAEGSYTFTVRVEDLAGNATEDQWHITVTAVELNQPPVITFQPVAWITTADLYNYQASATDDGDTLIWSLVEAPDGMSF